MMKVLIVDDEQHVIDAIRMLVDWSGLGILQVSELNDSTRALQWVHDNHPDIVLTDMNMPEVHGTALVEAIKAFDESIQIIVISGYSDFNYIQHTMRHGGVDYITKPIEPTQLEVALKKAITLIEEQQSIDDTKASIWHLTPLLWDQTFTEVLDHGRMNERYIGQMNETYALTEDSEVRLATLRILEYERILSQKFNADQNLLQFAIRNICYETIEMSDIDGYVYLNPNEPAHIRMMLWGKTVLMDSTIKKMINAIKKYYDVDAYAALSDSHTFPEYVPKAYRQSLGRLNKVNILKGNQRVYQTDDDHMVSKAVLNLNHDGILHDIRGLNRSGAARKIEDAFDDASQLVYMSIGMLKKLEDRMEHNLTYYRTQLGMKAQSPFGADLSEVMFTNKLVPALSRYFRDNIYAIIDLYETEHYSKTDPIEQIKRYMDQHYDEPISLRSLAEDNHLSKEHVARKFKQAYGVTVGAYLTDKRMNEAKEMLGNHTVAIKDVAVLVGYEDVKYFSKVFRNKFGLTPSDYRNT